MKFDSDWLNCFTGEDAKTLWTDDGERTDARAGVYYMVTL